MGALPILYFSEATKIASSRLTNLFYAVLKELSRIGADISCQDGSPGANGNIRKYCTTVGKKR